MPAQLPDDIWDQERLERQWYGLITPEHPLYPALLSLLRHCNTMSSAEGVALRIKHYLRYFVRRQIDPITASRDDLEAWLTSMKHLAPTTRQAYIAMAKNLYEELIDRDLISKNPARRLHVGRHTQATVRALTLAEARCVLDGIVAELGDADPLRQVTAARDYLLFAIAFTIGPRASELRRLTFGDFDLATERPTAHLFGKFQKHAEKLLPPIVLEALANYRAVLEPLIGREVRPDDAVLVPLAHRTLPEVRYVGDRPLRAMSAPGLFGVIRNRLRDAGIEGEKLGSHRLRKTAATLAWKATNDIVATSRLMSHARPDITWKAYVAPEEALDESPSLHIPLEPRGLRPPIPANFPGALGEHAEEVGDGTSL